MKLHIFIVGVVCLSTVSAGRTSEDSSPKREKHSHSSTKGAYVKGKRDAAVTYTSPVQQSPTSGYLPPSPHNSYGPPSVSVQPTSGYLPPAPHNSYGPPSLPSQPTSTYLPSVQHISPQISAPQTTNYGIPAQSYGPPGIWQSPQQQGYGSQSIGGPQISFGVPQYGGLGGFAGLGGLSGLGGGFGNLLSGIRGPGGPGGSGQGYNGGFGGAYGNGGGPYGNGGSPYGNAGGPYGNAGSPYGNAGSPYGSGYGSGYGGGLGSSFGNIFSQGLSGLGSGLSNLGSSITSGFGGFNPLSLYGGQGNSYAPSGSYLPSGGGFDQPQYAAGTRGLSHFATGPGAILSNSPIGLPLSSSRSSSFLTSRPTALTESSNLLGNNLQDSFRPSVFLGSSSPGLQLNAPSPTLTSLGVTSNYGQPAQFYGPPQTPSNTYLPSKPGNTYLPPPQTPSNTYLPSKPGSTFGGPTLPSQYSPQASNSYGTPLYSHDD